MDQISSINRPFLPGAGDDGSLLDHLPTESGGTSQTLAVFSQGPC
jgi:hypothetical protein